MSAVYAVCTNIYNRKEMIIFSLVKHVFDTIHAVCMVSDGAQMDQSFVFDEITMNILQ